MSSPESPPEQIATILLVDDHPSSRQPLAQLLNREPDLQVVGEAGSVAEACAKVETGSCPDIAIVDLDLGDGSGIEVIRHLRSVCGGTRILVLTGLKDDRARGQALYEGASGAMTKTASTAELIDAIRALTSSHGTVSPDEAIRLLRVWIDALQQDWESNRLLESLTGREQEVLLALTDGLSDEEISERLGMSTATTRSHVRAILTKLGVESRLKAVVLAFRAGHIRQ